MTYAFSIKRGATVPPFNATIEAAGGPVNLLGAAVLLRLRLVGSPVALEFAAGVVSSAAGTVRYQWQVGDTDMAGVYYAEWDITFADNSHLIVPSADQMFLKIYDSTAPIV